MKNKLTITLLAIMVLIVSLVAYLLSSKTLISPNRFENEIIKVETVSDSTEIEDIEKDLEDTNFENIDTELSDIETELD